MTDIEKKALALWGPGVTAEVNLHNFSILGTAFLEMRERHETFRQEVSDAVSGFFADDGFDRTDLLRRFIIAKPDPLVEAWMEAWPNDPLEAAEKETQALRAAIAKRGGKIVWEDEQ